MPYFNISLSVYQSTHHSLKLYTLYRELILLTVIKQSSNPTKYNLGFMIQVEIKLTVQRLKNIGIYTRHMN